MKAYKICDDCHELGYFKSQKDVAFYIKNDEDVAQWFEDYEEFIELTKAYDNGEIEWQEYRSTLMEHCIYIEEIEIIGE